MNKITEIRFFEAKTDKAGRVADATHSISEVKFIICEIETETGVVGHGYCLTFDYSKNAIRGALKDIAEFAIGFEVNETVKFYSEYNKLTEYFGQQGLLKWALSVINIAMWDAWGKINNQPIWKLLGGHSQKIPIYGSGGWLSYGNEELVDEVIGYKKRGFKSVKIKVGSKNIERDIERLTLVREAVGKDIKIMMDANQGLKLDKAIALVQRANKLNIYWFEDPISRTNYKGYQTLKQNSPISITTGEREYDLESLKRLIELNAIDLWQPDIVRIGGVEQWRSSAIYADTHHIPVLPHYYKDYDVPLLCTVDNGYGVESFDWIDELIDNKLKIEDGLVVPRNGSGWGFKFLYEKMTELVL